jgi:hypothetical protein
MAILSAALAIGVLARKLCFPGQNAPAAPPALLTQWEYQLYLLDDDESVRFVPPPFSAQRLTKFPRISGFRRPIRPAEQYLCTVKGGQIFVAYFAFQGNIDSAFMLCTDLYRSLDLEICGNIDRWFADGDWILKEEAPLERRMKALESILSTFTGRKLVIEKRQVERDVIVARGKWRLASDDESNGEEFCYLARGHFVTHGPNGTLAESFASLERGLGRKFIDETDEPHPPAVRWMPLGLPFRVNDAALRNQFLTRLEKQTSLKFLQTRRVISVWIVSERGQEQ